MGPGRGLSTMRLVEVHKPGQAHLPERCLPNLLFVKMPTVNQKKPPNSIPLQSQKNSVDRPATNQPCNSCRFISNTHFQTATAISQLQTCAVLTQQSQRRTSNKGDNTEPT